MDDLERRLAALRDLPVEYGPPRVDVIARRARVRRRWGAIAGAGLVVVVALGGFAAFQSLGFGGTGRAGRSVLTAAQTATVAEQTARMESEISLDTEAADFSHHQTTHSEGEIDFVANRSYSIAESDDFPNGSMEVIYDGNTVYQKGASTEQPDKWVKSAVAMSAEFPEVQGAPNDILSWIVQPASRIDELEPERLDGELVDHYRVVIDSEAFVDQLFEAMPDLPASSRDLEWDVEPADVWIDSAGRVRKVSMAWSITSTAVPGGLKVDFSSTFRYFDFGTPVDIQLPPAEDVVEGPPPGIGLPPEPGPTPRPRYDETLVVGRYGTDTAYLLLSKGPDSAMLCVSQVPAWAEIARVIDERTGNAVATFDEGDMTAPLGEKGRFGCRLVAARHVNEIIETPDEYLLQIPGAFPDRSIQLTTAQEYRAKD